MTDAMEQRAEEPNRVQGSSQILHEAVLWAVRLRVGSLDARAQQEFSQWLEACPSHLGAWQAVQRVESLFDDLPPGAGILVASTLKRAADGAPSSPSRRKSLMLLAGSLLGAGSGLFWHTEISQPRAAWHTDADEFLCTQLPDATLLEMNPGTRIAVHYSIVDRRLILSRGEIRVETGTDPEFRFRRRPFQVDSPHARLRAIGTSFSVRSGPDTTRLHVETGRVATIIAGRLVSVANPGDQVRIDASGRWLSMEATPPHFPSPNVRVLVAHATPLEKLLEQLAPFYDGKLACDPTAARLKVSGVFQLGSADALARALHLMTQTLPVRIDQGFAGTLLVRLAD